MTTVSNELPAVLRRRARKLHDEGFNAEFVQPLLTAADELTVRRRCTTDAEQDAIDAVNANRLLGHRLANIARIIESSTMATALKEKVGQELRIASLLLLQDNQRRIISLALEPGTTMADFMIRARAEYEKYAIDTGGTRETVD